MQEKQMRVAVVGNGVMGRAISRRLLDTGAAVHVFDTNPEKMQALVASGACASTSPAAACAEADTIIISLNTADIVEQAVFGDQGVASAAGPGKVLVDMSSIDPERTRAMAQRLRDTTGMAWVDAPLSGGAPAAATGSMTLMLGGRELDVTRVTPLLQKLSGNFTRMGDCGAGQTVKLVNQILCAAGFMAVAEAVAFAEAQGVDASHIPAALAGGRADSRILQEYMGKMAQRDYSPTGRIDNMLKDMETVQKAAFDQRLPLPLSSLITDLHRMLVAGGLGAADSAEYMRLFSFGRDRQPD